MSCDAINWLLGFPTRSDTNRSVQSPKRTRIFQLTRTCTICVAESKALICGFVFASAKIWFSHDTAHII